MDKEDMATAPQIKYLAQKGVKDAYNLSKKEAHQLISEMVNKGAMDRTKELKPSFEWQKPKEQEIVQPEASKSENKHITMYVSYCKDLIVAGYKTEDAIKAIKEVKRAFE